MSAYSPVLPQEHAPGCHRSWRPEHPALDTAHCPRCAELWRRVGGVRPLECRR